VILESLAKPQSRGNICRAHRARLQRSSADAGGSRTEPTPPPHQSNNPLIQCPCSFSKTFPSRTPFNRYATGEGTEKNYTEAYAWLSVYNSSEWFHAENELMELIPKMTPEELEAGKALAEEYSAKFRPLDE
jgi:hypothetical protein